MTIFKILYRGIATCSVAVPTSPAALILCALFACLANTAAADPHSDGLSLGQSQLNKLSSNVNSANAKNVPNYNENPPQSGQFGSASLFTVGAARITTCKTEQPGSDKVKNQECGAVNFLAKNPEERVKVPIGGNDPIFDGISDIINKTKPGVVTDGCQDKTTTTPNIYETETCNEFNLSVDKTCSMGQLVQVDAKSNYQCNVTSNAVTQYTCDKYVVVSCPDDPTWCSAGGITPGSVGQSTGSASITYSNPYLDAYQYINTQNRRETSTFQFNIADINQIGMFRLVYAQFDNWLALVINGRFVRVFRSQLPDSIAYAANKLVLATCGKRVCVDIGVGTLYAVEPGLFPLSGNFDLDMRQFLKSGVNTIEFILINGNAQGVGEAKFEVRARCTPCTTTWVDQCQDFERRSQ